MVVLTHCDGVVCCFFTDTEVAKFRDYEARFQRTFKMPVQEKLVNCKWTECACHQPVTLSLVCHLVISLSPCHQPVILSSVCDLVFSLSPCHQSVTLSSVCDLVISPSPCHQFVILSLVCHLVTCPS